MKKWDKRETTNLYLQIYELFELHVCIDEKDIKSMMDMICDVINEAAYDYTKDNKIDNEYALIVSD